MSLARQFLSKVNESSVIKTNNVLYGFYGTMATSIESTGFEGDLDAYVDKLYTKAAKAIMKASGINDTSVIVKFLDSRSGRHFADSIAQYIWPKEDARIPYTDKMYDKLLKDAVKEWVNWTAKDSFKKQYKIPNEYNKNLLTQRIYIDGVLPE